jgi:hypothetical protein
MPTQRQTPRGKTRNIAARSGGTPPREPQSSTPPGSDVDRQRPEPPNAPPRHILLSLREEEGDDTATRH